MSDFITRFFDEKKLENKCYEVESSNGVLHILHTEDVIYAIKQMPESNRSRVETVLRQLYRLCLPDGEYIPALPLLLKKSISENRYG